MKQRDEINIEVLKELKQGKISSKLKEYSGWGGLRESVFNPQIYRQLKSILSDSEIKNIKESAKSAYFTPKKMIQGIYAILENIGFEGGKILEPAAGHGAFIEYMPVNMRKASQITAIEIETFSVQILKALYPEISIKDKGFETHNFKPEFDLVIGNPPYTQV